MEPQFKSMFSPQDNVLNIEQERLSHSQKIVQLSSDINVIAQKLVREHNANADNLQIQQYRDLIAELTATLQREVTAIMALDNKLKHHQYFSPLSGQTPFPQNFLQVTTANDVKPLTSYLKEKEQELPRME